MATGDRDGRIAQWLSDGHALLGMEMGESFRERLAAFDALLDGVKLAAVRAACDAEIDDHEFRRRVVHIVLGDGQGAQGVREPVPEWERPFLDQPQHDVYVVTGPSGFTESFSREQIDLLERMGLIRHERDGHVLEDGQGRGVGPLHRFYREAAS